MVLLFAVSAHSVSLVSMIEAPPIVAAAACGLTALAVSPIRRLAWDWGFVDLPTGRKRHERATPMLGGLALVVGMLLPPLLVSVENPRLFALAGATLVLTAVGLVDDRLGVGVVGKLAMQAAAAAIVVAAGFAAPWSATLGPTLGGLAAGLFLVLVINAVNLLDNVDGLAAGTAAVSALGVLALGADGLAALLAAALVGAAIGFLLHNWSPARIFMGDAGSMPLGLIVGVLGLEAARLGPGRWSPWLLPALVLLVPLADTATVIVSRLLRGRNPLTSPGTDHLSHRLARRGLGTEGAVGVLVLAGLAANAVATLLLVFAAAFSEVP